MRKPVAILDACVLYPATLRSFLMYLAVEDVFRARWSNPIHDEWTRSVLSNHPDIRPEQLERTRALMDAHVLDSVVTGYEPLIETLMLPDPDDRHVLAAAITAQADVIVTFNLSDFPDRLLASHGLVARSLDDFVRRLFESDPTAVCRALVNQRRAMKKPPKIALELLSDLKRCGLSATAGVLRAFADQL